MRTKIVLIFLVFATIFIIIMIIGSRPFLNSVAPSVENSSAKDVPIPKINFSNPEYINKPSDFLVDQTDLVTSNLPINEPVWAEGVINENTIKVSFVIEKEGRKILKIKPLSIAYLDSYQNYENEVFRDMLKGLSSQLFFMPAFIRCMRTPTLNALNKMVTSQYVRLRSIDGESSRILIINGLDVGQEMIKSGLGVVATNEDIPLYGTGTKEDLLEDIERHAVIVDKKGEYWQKLISQQQIARLENIGIWKSCDFKDFTGSAGF